MKVMGRKEDMKRDRGGLASNKYDKDCSELIDDIDPSATRRRVIKLRDSSIIKLTINMKINFGATLVRRERKEGSLFCPRDQWEID